MFGKKEECNILNIYLINHNCTGITTNMSATSNNTVGHKCTACQLCQKLNSHRALMDSDGLPYKGTKSYTTTYLERRYTTPPVIVNTLPTGWLPHSVILEGMFLIQMSPLPSMNCMEDYVKLLLSRYVKPQV